ncbi:MAG: succinate dehydrogenase, cytochrome b556 subunit [Alphaproteobacteria bacterium]|nr:succinate dehydrogenase, cytochrome b556 subunit [Alphaproteobacteria bacterium]
MVTPQRPLSPHLSVYRFQWTMALSILHRLTGLGLGAGLVLLTWWLAAAATGPDAFASVRAFTGSIPGRFVVLGFTFSLFYHLCNGIRHLAWDFGFGYSLRTAHASGWISLMAAIALTLLAWMAGYAARGAL